VRNVERFGDSSLLYVEHADANDPLILRTDGGTRLQRGDAVSLALPAEHIHGFDQEERALVRSVDPLS
jgi:ABC-type sugar transport system ATPase subunit